MPCKWSITNRHILVAGVRSDMYMCPKCPTKYTLAFEAPNARLLKVYTPINRRRHGDGTLMLASWPEGAISNQHNLNSYLEGRGEREFENN